MGNLKRKIENIKIDGKDYILAFDMTSVDKFQELNKNGVLQSIIPLNNFEDKVVLDFIASTLRRKSQPNEPIGKELYNGDFDLLSIMIMFLPTIIKVINEGFPQETEKRGKQRKN